MNTKKLKKVAICLVVLLMVVAGTLAWLTTSEFKKGKIGAGNFSINVEAVRVANEEDANVTSDLFVPTNEEKAYQEADETSAETIFHYSDDALYPVASNNVDALLNGNKVVTKYIRITNNNDTDALIELRGEYAEGFANKAAHVSWLLGVPYESVLPMADQYTKLYATSNNADAAIDALSSGVFAAEEDADDEEPAAEVPAAKVPASEAPVAEKSLNNILKRISSIATTNDNGFFDLFTIGHTLDERKEALVYAKDADGVETDEINGSSIVYDTEEGKTLENDLKTLTERRVIVPETSMIYTQQTNSNSKVNDDSAEHEMILANILKQENESPDLEDEYEEDGVKYEEPDGYYYGDGTTPTSGGYAFTEATEVEAMEANVLNEVVDGAYVEKTFEDSTLTDYALPLILRAHTSIVIPFKVFLNENWTNEDKAETGNDFEYNIVVKARNYTEGDDITFTTNTTKKVADTASNTNITEEQLDTAIKELYCEFNEIDEFNGYANSEKIKIFKNEMIGEDTNFNNAYNTVTSITNGIKDAKKTAESNEDGYSWEYLVELDDKYYHVYEFLDKYGSLLTSNVAIAVKKTALAEK